MKRILIVNVNWLGDTLFVTPFIKAMRENHPSSYIAVFTHPRCREILEDNPYINEIILYDEKHKHRNLLAKFSMVSQLKAKRFDIAFILRKSLSRAMILFLSKIPERIGYDNRKSGFLLTKKIPAPTKELHKAEYFLGLAKAIGIHSREIKCEFFLSDKDRIRANDILKSEGLDGIREEFIVLNPGGNWELKRWPPENFAKLGDEIYNRLNVKVVLTGALGDVSLCERIACLMRQRPYLLCGKTDLKTLGAVFERAKWVISNDSGPMHIAVGVGTRVVAIFGPTSPNITGPYGEGAYIVLQKKVDCSVPCYNLSCKDNRCMKEISVEEVLEAIS